MDYDYFESVKSDVRDFIEDLRQEENDIDDSQGYEVWEQEYSNFEELNDYLHETMLTDDSITGGDSGSYTFDSYTAAEYICHNWDLLKDALDYVGESHWDALDNGYEWCDVIIRRYVFDQVLEDACEELGLQEIFN